MLFWNCGAGGLQDQLKAKDRKQLRYVLPFAFSCAMNACFVVTAGRRFLPQERASQACITAGRIRMLYCWIR